MSRSAHQTSERNLLNAIPEQGTDENEGPVIIDPFWDQDGDDTNSGSYLSILEEQALLLAGEESLPFFALDESPSTLTLVTDQIMLTNMATGQSFGLDSGLFDVSIAVSTDQAATLVFSLSPEGYVALGLAELDEGEEVNLSLTLQVVDEEGALSNIHQMRLNVQGQDDACTVPQIIAQLVGTNAADIFTQTNFPIINDEANTIDALGGNDFISSLGGDDIVLAGSGNDIVYAGAGNDAVYGQDGNDRLYLDDWSAFQTGTPGSGDDFACGGAGNDQIFGMGGNDEIHGGIGDDLLFGHDGHDTLMGGFGNDYIYGGTGDDTIDGGFGDDLIVADEQGFHGGDDTIIGGFGDDVIYAGGGNDLVNGGEGNDTIYAGDGDDSVHGGAGHDVIYLEDGDDTVTGSAGHDVIFGGGGNDTITAGPGNNKVYGGEGNDTIYAVDGDDRIYGNNGDDYLSAWSGSNHIDGGNGNDTLNGGNGNDRFYFSQGQDEILNFGDDPDGLLGNDVIVMTGWASSYSDLQFSLDQFGDIVVAANSNSVALRDFNFSTLDSSDFIF